MDPDYFDFIVVGGGIAGVACAETLCELIRPSRFSGAGIVEQINPSNCRVALISASPTVKTTINLRRITNMIESFEVTEVSGDSWSEAWAGTLTILYDTVERLDPTSHCLHLTNRISGPLRYGRICISTGGLPRLIHPSNPRVITLRDTESLATFQKRLEDTRRLVLVGNGGIATEIAHEVRGCQIIWAVKHTSISTPFLDPVAAKFLLDARQSTTTASTQGDPNAEGDFPGPVQIRRMRYIVPEAPSAQTSRMSPSNRELILVPTEAHKVHRGSPVYGAALGPDWAHKKEFYGKLGSQVDSAALKVVYQVQVDRVLTGEEFQSSPDLKATDLFGDSLSECDATQPWPVYVQLTNGEVYGCDLVISAVGVEANFEASRSRVTGVKETFFTTPFDTAPASLGGGVLVDDQMQTSEPEVYAAGDCAYANWTWAPHWFPMRLWNQARQMGFQAAKAMFGHSRGETEVPLDFSFELFTHVTYFFGFKVVLLGLYNGQGLDLTAPECYLLMRITPGREYVKVIMQSGRMQGALLIGDTDLEETFENLIVNQLDLTDVEDSLLDPNIDFSDYFD